MADEAQDDVNPPDEGQDVISSDTAASHGSYVDQTSARPEIDHGILESPAPAGMPSDDALAPASAAEQPPPQNSDDDGVYGGAGQRDESLREFLLRETALQMIRDDPVAMNCLQWHHVKVRPDGTRLGFDEVTGQYWPVPPVSEATLRGVLGPHFADVQQRLSTIPLVTASALNYGFGGTPDPAAADRLAAQAIDSEEESPAPAETMAADAGSDTSPMPYANATSGSDGVEDTIPANVSADEPHGAQLAQAAPAAAGRDPVAGRGSGDRVEYHRPDGSRIMREGGTRPWRTNNPGALGDTDFSYRHGAIGWHAVPGYPDIAIFPDRETGAQALRALLASPRYQRRTLDQVMEKYAPPRENNTQRYQEFVRDSLGLPGTTQLRDLTAVQMDRLLATIMRMEGWQPGTVRQIPPPE